MPILLVVIYLALCAIAAFWAAAMKRNWKNWFLVALLLSPLGAYIGLIIVFFISGQPRRIGHAVKQGTQSIYDSSKERISGEKPLDDQDREFYTKAGSEVASKSYDPGLFAKAFSEADGDENKAKAIYIRYRVAELRHKRKDRQAMDARDKNGRTPLLLAAIGGDIDSIIAALKKGADVNAMDLSGKTALMEAAANGYLDIVKFLVDKGADVNARNKDGRTPLLLAAIGGELDVVKVLMDKGADINARDKSNYTPLMWAAYMGNLEVVKFLMQKGADANAKDELGWTPMSLAKKENYQDVVEFLKQHGAK